MLKVDADNIAGLFSQRKIPTLLHMLSQTTNFTVILITIQNEIIGSTILAIRGLKFYYYYPFTLRINPFPGQAAGRYLRQTDDSAGL
jgi:hypothetical protein